MIWKLHQLYKRYGQQQALAGVDFTTAEDLRCLAFIGPSGGGKSTLLRHLAGLEVPDTGQISLNGKALPNTEKPLLAYRRENGFLFQSYNLFPHLDVLKNITLPLEKVHGLSPAAARDRAEALLARFQLQTHAYKQPHQLSGGQQQRVGLVRAAAARPQILFLDEPTAALDPEMTWEVLLLIRDLLQDGQRLVLSTHEIGFAKAAADHIGFVAEGRMLEHGPPRELLEQPKESVVKGFLEKTQMFR